ncbi:MAG: hypothetical protein E6J53_04380 [Chloroflexi bacterium]|nr:MAG: hypothetical protein E6J53_04380 [Chloroflexota bacterium]
MTVTGMEPAAPPIEQTSVEPVESYSPSSVARRVPRPSTWIPLFARRERTLFALALAGALLVSAGGIGLLYADDTNNQAKIHGLTLRNESLTGRTQNLEDQLKTTQTNLTATLGQLAETKAELEHPHLTIWNVPQQLKGPTWYLAGGVPDTFTYHLQATSTGPMSVSILTLEQWGKAITCIDGGAGTTNYCMHHSGVAISWLNVTSVNYDFHMAEGCADYLAVFTAASTITVTPNVSVTYNPASGSTGACS